MWGGVGVAGLCAVGMSDSVCADGQRFNDSMAPPPAKLRVGVLGATGAVGQRFLERLDDVRAVPVHALVGLSVGAASVSEK